MTTASKVRMLLGKMKTIRRGIRREGRRKRAGSRAEFTEQETVEKSGRSTPEPDPLAV